MAQVTNGAVVARQDAVALRSEAAVGWSRVAVQQRGATVVVALGSMARCWSVPRDSTLVNGSKLEIGCSGREGGRRLAAHI